MPKKRSLELFLLDILESIERIENYIRGLDRNGFIKDEKTADAVIRNLEIIGEAARNIPDEVKEKHNHVPWKKVVGFRNILIHEYFFVDLQNVWFVVTEQLPELKSDVQKILIE